MAKRKKLDTPRPIEHIQYTQTFRLDPTKWREIYSLVNHGEKQVKRSEGLQIQDKDGNVTTIAWGTVVYPI